ncbi:putative chloramphenical resistance permease RarD [Thalassovita autumnalis]|uniref:Chloramphenical resistance permease RarD n=1 Tax=Thalassovita autumnalis TaxID=2072972 RepID=A0A0N7LWS2_9RHOB|nr:EamA family transporter RarD [Thalassovita autumnalis]CUH69890.1 putative chloramphenical resistance permease RarD [Thalassovita autumnalis]CUH73277.1 putative chloramphenical resistance permease RarD [Thalassovita autumnalis]
MSQSSDQNVDTPQGLAYAMGAYVIWGFLPLYMKLVDHIPAVEVVANRVIWAVPLAAALLIYRRRTADLFLALRTPRMLAMACVTAVLVSINWGIYVWSIAADRALDAALGYYINPLFSVALGAMLLGERLSRAQWLAISLAAVAVGVLWYDAGSLPWPAVGLTVSWGFYAFFKKSLPIGPNQGFLLEVLILLPFAIGYVGYLAAAGQGHLGASLSDTSLLLGMGVVTAVPLILYANGAKLLRLSTIGILQYSAPTMIFLLAVLVFDEPFDRARMIAFPLIWAALVIYTVPMVQGLRKSRG